MRRLSNSPICAVIYRGEVGGTIGLVHGVHLSDLDQPFAGQVLQGIAVQSMATDALP
jgi:hypothetical protein